MSKCQNCKKYEDCVTGSGLTWPCGAYVPKVITNADYIRSMTDEDLAKFIPEWSYKVIELLKPMITQKRKLGGENESTA